MSLPEEIESDLSSMPSLPISNLKFKPNNFLTNPEEKQFIDEKSMFSQKGNLEDITGKKLGVSGEGSMDVLQGAQKKRNLVSAVSKRTDTIAFIHCVPMQLVV